MRNIPPYIDGTMHRPVFTLYNAWTEAEDMAEERHRKQSHIYYERTTGPKAKQRQKRVNATRRNQPKLVAEVRCHGGQRSFEFFLFCLATPRAVGGDTRFGQIAERVRARHHALVNASRGSIPEAAAANVGMAVSSNSNAT